MSKKTSADVLIGGRIYTLCGYESEEYLQKVANYINNKINEYDSMEKFRRLPMEIKTALVELNIADDYFKAREQAEKLDQDVKEKEKEIYELKHELISARIKVESSEKINAELEKENRKLLLHKAKLEATLEDTLLGEVKEQGQKSKSRNSFQNKNSTIMEETILEDELELEDGLELENELEIRSNLENKLKIKYEIEDEPEIENESEIEDKLEDELEDESELENESKIEDELEIKSLENKV